MLTRPTEYWSTFTAWESTCLLHRWGTPDDVARDFVPEAVKRGCVVIDESGYVQPTITDLRKLRGTNSVYHNNSIQTWQVKPDGSVFDVQLA